VRRGDATARLGGEEFGILLTDTNASGAIDLAFRIQTELSQQIQDPAPITVSVGISSIAGEIESWEQLLCRADGAMYEAKRLGKNRVVHHDSLAATIPTVPGISLGSDRPKQISCE
jgi:diguanylate cyclase (GGDEF)-like protein